MKAIVQDKYGPSPDVLDLREIDKPVVGEEDVLVRVRAAGVDQGVWASSRLRPSLSPVMRLCRLSATRESAAGSAGSDHRRGGRRRLVRGADREGVRGGRDRRVQHGQDRVRAFARCRSCDRLHARRLRSAAGKVVITV